MAEQEDVKDNTQTAALVWLIIAMVIAIVMYLSYYFTNSGKKKKESKFS